MVVSQKDFGTPWVSGMQGIHVSVVAALEFDDEVAPGEAARQANGGHGGFGSGIHQPHHFDGRHGPADGLRQRDFLLRRRAEAGAYGQRLLQRRQNLRVPVAQQQRPPRADVVDVLLPIDVENMRAFAAREERRRPTHAAEGAHRRIHAAGNDFLCPAEEGFGFGHARAFLGTSRLKPKLMKIS
jgi:uncharacterized Zn-finger protein